jgi:hypothetical protein
MIPSFVGGWVAPIAGTASPSAAAAGILTKFSIAIGPLTESQASRSEFNTPRSENNTNFSSNAQEKAATRGGHRGSTSSISAFYLPSQRIQPMGEPLTATLTKSEKGRIGAQGGGMALLLLL